MVTYQRTAGPKPAVVTVRAHTRPANVRRNNNTAAPTEKLRATKKTDIKHGTSFVQCVWLLGKTYAAAWKQELVDMPQLWYRIGDHM